MPSSDTSSAAPPAGGSHRAPFGMPAVWTEAKVARLRALWADASYSAAAIARLIGGVSRSAVLGKVHRLGLESRAGVPALRRARTPGEVRPFGALRFGGGMRRVKAGAASGGASGPETRVTRRLTIEDWLAHATQPFVDLPAETSPFAVTLADLAPRQCRWPLGDPASADFRFCGDSRAGPTAYCARHRAMAYRPAPARAGQDTARTPARSLP